MSRKRQVHSARTRAVSAPRWTLSKRLLIVLGFLLFVGQGGRPGPSSAIQAQACVPELSNEIVCENALPGSSGWDIVGAGDPTLQGFATDISVDQGGTVGFKVKSGAPYRIHIYRLGYYGGLGARKVATLPDETGTLPANAQLTCLADQNTGLVDCGNWAETASWTVPANATSGVYLAKLEYAAAPNGASHIVFVVRDDDGASDLLFQTSDTTWQAYNNYGGNSLYEGASHLGGWRAVAVSYNRPMNTRAVDYRSFFFNGEYPMLRFLEANGYDVSYFTGVDSDRRGAEIREHNVFLSVGHDEYWSANQRASVEAARDAATPVHLAFFSGNESFWKIRWDADSFGGAHRTLVSYKETHANGKIDPTPGVWTGTWRDTRFGPHDGGRPENALTGTLFMVNAGDTGAIRVPAAQGKLRFWRNTPNVSTQTTGAFTLPFGTIGHEWDEDVDNGSRPAGAIRLSGTQLTVGSKLLDNGSTYGPGVATHSLMLHKRANGARVFGAGTVQWSWGVSNVHDDENPQLAASVDMQQATVNLLADMGVQPRTLMGTLAPATASNDNTAPSSQITSPLAGAVVSVGSQVTIQGSAADAGGLVASVEVSVDNGATWHPAAGTGSWSYSWIPTAAGATTIRSRAADDSANIETPSAGVTIQVNPPAPPPATGPFTLWNNAAPTGAVTNHGDFSAVETGVRFRSDVSGYITGMRFYKISTNVGPHRGRIWLPNASGGGTELGSVTFSGETASGWQEALFPSPIPVSANTGYVASYHSPQGQYIFSGGYFNTQYSNAPLHAFQDGVQGGNGLYAYGAGGFPTNTFNATNYWVDVVFVTALPADDTAPTVTAVIPPNLSSDVSASTNVRVVFSEGMNVATLTGSTVTLRNAANLIVPASITYAAATKTATINPAAPLDRSTTYRVFIQGGASGVKDIAGNPLADHFQSTFTTVPALPDPTSGPGGPILLITQASNHFTKYYAEILRAEGLNQFAVADISTVNSGTLSSHEVVLLGEMPLTAAQVTMFTNWVNAGGKLIAMRPDKQLASLLGLTDAGGSASDQYLLVSTASGPGKGIVNQTIQYHGAADRYTLSGATSVAELYSTASTPSGYPAVTVRQVGAGMAAAFTYDLAKSVLLTRQGNPAWEGQERDGFPPIRADDLFYGNATIAGGSLDRNGNPLQDPKPDWVDLNKVAIPQADEQMRLLANLTLHISDMPLPRFWYFPNGKKAVVIMTGDDHLSGGTAGRFDIFKNDPNTPNCSVADWTCIRSTSYVYAGSIDDAAAAAYAQDGFEIGLHLNTGCQNFTPTSLRGFFTDQLDVFASTYPSLEPPQTHRIHCLVWSDYSTLPIVSLENGIRLDTSYYYWPSQWVQDRPGFFTGSGLPMRHAKTNGEIIDVYQADTKMTDESGQTFPFTPRTLFTRAVGPEGYYGAFTANMHTDSPTSADAQGILDEALPRGIPIISSKQMLDWLDGRNASSFAGLTWDGTTLGFTVVAGPSTHGLEAMIPTKMPGTSLTLSLVRRNGVGLAYKRVETIKGVEYAFVDATTGAYEAVYDNGGAPVITALAASGTAAGTATFTWQTNEAANSRVQYGTSPTALTSDAQSASMVTAHQLEVAGLVGGTTYYYRVTSADAGGASTTSPPVAQAPASFVMPGPIVTAANVSVGEGSGPAAVTLQLSNVAAQDVVVTFATSDGTATAGADYTGTASGTATIPAGSTSAVVQVPITADAVDEADETFVVSFTGVTNGTLGTPQVTVTIADDDGAPSLSIADVSVAEGNAGVTNAVFTVSLSAPSAQPVSVDFATADDTALAASDYVASSGQLVIPAGETSGQVVVPVVGDAMFEADERFRVSLSNASNATVAQAQAFGTITNDDGAPTVSIGDVTVAEAGGNAVFTVSLSQPSAVNVVVDFATANGTALAGADYTARSGAVTIPAGSSSATLNVAVLTDSLDEADETFTVTLSNPQNATILDGSATGTITDDDATPSLAIADVTVSEGQTGTVNAVFTVTLSGASGQPVSVDVATANGTATAGADYVAKSATLEFTAGQTSKIVEVVINGDRVDEADETYLVHLANATNATIADAQATGTITDDDASPVVVDGSASTPEDAVVIIDVLANVTEGDGDTLTIESVTQGAHGTVAIIAAGPDAGKVRYTPNENFFGSDTFTYTVSDGHGNTSSGAVTVTITSVNDAPVAVADTYSTPEDTPLVVAARGVLTNDTDADEDGLTAAVVAQPGHGTVTLAADGAFTYTPAADFSGTDTFTYKANDDTTDSNVATVTITINAVNDAPVAVNDSYTTDEDQALTIAAPGVLGNDTDADAGTTLTAVVVAQPTKGSLTLNANGSFTYTPQANVSGTDSFTYKANDGTVDSNVATVTITINGVNDAPVAVNDSYSTNEDVVLSVLAPGVLGNDTDSDNTTLTVALVAGPANGTLELSANGSFTYTPNAQFSGSDSFTYKANDGTSNSNVATVTITINAVNDAPVAVNDSFTTDEDQALTIAAPGVLGNDTDSDSTTLTAAVVAGPANGTLTLNPNGSFSYTPNAQFSGTDTFTYRANDGSANSNVATATITVTGVNDAPVANDDTASVAEDSAATAIDVRANDTDHDGDTLSITAVTQGSNGAVLITGGGTGLTYAPNANYVGADSFTYTISDGHGGSDSATVNVTVTAVNDAPVAVGDSYSTNEDVVLSVLAPGVLGNDTDSDNATLTAAVVAGPANGTLTLNANGSFTYTPNAQFSGTDSFTYRANDGDANSNEATVTITINAVNDPPVANDDTATVAEDSGANAINVRGNDTEPDGDTLTITAVTQGAKGSVAITGGGTGLTYTPNANVNGTDSFTYTVSDGQGGSDSATVNITVTAVNDAPVAVNNAYSTNQGVVLNVAAPGVLANDTDVDNATLTAQLVAGPSHGTLTLNPNGAVSYTPAAGYSGPDTFTYRASDGSATSNVATVSITVIAANQAPVAVNDAYTTNEDIVLNVAAAGVLANDTDVDGNPLTAAVVTGPTKGTLTLNANGSFSYTPNANANGSDSFTYRANDGTLNSNTATVTITVNAVNDPPVVVNDTLSVLQGSAATAVNVLANDSNVEAGETLTITAVTQGANGTVTFTASSVSYTPANSTYTGPDSFTYTVADGNGGSSTATVNVTVLAKPTITITDADIVEGNSGTKDATVTVSLSHAVVAPVTVKYATANGVARSGSDYIAATGTLTFAAGETSKPVVVKVIGETTKERDETFAVSLSLPTNATIARTNGFITIIDDDSTPTATLSGSKTSEGSTSTSTMTSGSMQLASMSLMSASLSDTTALDSPSTKMAVFTITLTNPSEIPIAVDYRTVDGTGVAGEDYTAVFGTLTFAEDETVKTIEVPIRPDIKHELDEAFTIELTNPVELMLGNATVSSVILDDDPAPFIDVTDVRVIEGNDGASQAVFTVTLASESGKAESVKYTTGNGTAVAGSDYTAVSGEIPFAAGVTVQQVVVPITADREMEADETFFLNLIQASDAPLAKTRAVATIVNDDTAAAKPTLSIGDAAPVAEGNSGTTSAQFIVALSSPATELVTVAYATADSTAVAGSDYTAASGTLTFGVGEQFKTVLVPVVGDTLEEKAEVFFVNLGAVSGATVLDGQGLGTIVNDDAAAWTTSTVADFTTGTVDSGAFVMTSPGNDGSLTLLPAVRNEFTATVLPTAWSSTLKKGGSVKLASDLMTIDFATVNNTTLYTAGKAIDFVATFSGAVNQLAGFTSAQFIVKTDGFLYARSTSTPLSETKLDVAFNVPHRFRIVWTAGRMRYEVDGNVVADHVWGSLPTQMPLQFADLTAVGGGSLVIDWVRVTPYASAGTFTSKVYDAGTAVAWMSADATATVPAGTDVIVTMRTGNTATPDTSWSGFAKVDGTAVGRYAQYRIELKTTVPAETPAVDKLVVTYEQR